MATQHLAWETGNQLEPKGLKLGAKDCGNPSGKGSVEVGGGSGKRAREVTEVGRESRRTLSPRRVPFRGKGPHHSAPTPSPP